jgi:hypothetical protein
MKNVGPPMGLEIVGTCLLLMVAFYQLIYVGTLFDTFMSLLWHRNGKNVTSEE